MPTQSQIRTALSALQTTAPAGFALAFHVRFTTPTFLFQTYAKDWLDFYSQNGLVMSDPTVAWAFQNQGAVRWSDLAGEDPAGVLVKAAEYGMKYGTTFSVGTEESPSLGSFARADREFTQEETQDMISLVTRLHEITADLDQIDPDTRADLRTMSVQFTHSE